MPARHCWLVGAAGATSAAAAASGARGSARQSRGGAGGRGGLQGRGRAARAFPLPGRAPAGTTSSSPSAGCPRRPHPGHTFRVGRSKKETFVEGADWGAPWAPGTQRGVGTAGPSRSPPAYGYAPRSRTDPREEPFFSASRPPQCLGRPGLSSAGVPARPGLAPAGGPAAWPVACSPCCAQGLGGRGPESLARSPRAHTRAHTLPPVACFPLATMVADTKGASARVFVVSPTQPPAPTFPRGGPSSSWLQGTPTFGIL